MIAVGTVAGVWMGIEGDTNSIRQVLALPDVSQMAVIPEPHILMILAGKFVCETKTGEEEAILMMCLLL
jgi:hypothetical protein